MSVSTFLHSVSVLLPVLFVMALGLGAGRAREFSREQLDGLTELVLKYALPAMLFVGVVSTPQLRDLEKDGVVARKVYPEVPPKVEYKLAKDEMALRAALKALKSWAASRDSRLSIKGFCDRSVTSPDVRL